MEPEAYVTEVDGKLVLVDPMACAMIEAINYRNKSLCRSTLEPQMDRAKHFARRVRELGRRPSEVVITMLNVDDPHGGAVADLLMPGHDWQQYRDRGEVPFARGLAGRDGIQDILDELDPLEGQKLREAWAVNVVVVMDHGAVEVFKEGEDF